MLLRSLWSDLKGQGLLYTTYLGLFSFYCKMSSVFDVCWAQLANSSHTYWFNKHWLSDVLLSCCWDFLSELLSRPKVTKNKPLDPSLHITWHFYSLSNHISPCFYTQQQSAAFLCHHPAASPQPETPCCTAVAALVWISGYKWVASHWWQLMISWKLFWAAALLKKPGGIIYNETQSG